MTINKVINSEIELVVGRRYRFPCFDSYDNQSGKRVFVWKEGVLFKKVPTKDVGDVKGAPQQGSCLNNLGEYSYAFDCGQAKPTDTQKGFMRIHQGRIICTAIAPEIPLFLSNGWITEAI